jgi:hypothetical protein
MAIFKAWPLATAYGDYQRLGDYTASLLTGVHRNPARCGDPLQNPPQSTISRPTAVPAVIPTPARSPNLWTLPPVMSLITERDVFSALSDHGI